jgi:hypothetical protein
MSSAEWVTEAHVPSVESLRDRTDMTVHPRSGAPRDPPSHAPHTFHAPGSAGLKRATQTVPRSDRDLPSGQVARARLVLNVCPPHRPAEGVWWPRSADLERELVPLAAALADAGAGRVERLSYDRSAWLPASRRRPPSDGHVEIRASGTAGSRQITVAMHEGGLVVLRVLPAATPDGPGQRAMRQEPEPPVERPAVTVLTQRTRTDLDAEVRPWFGTGGPAVRPPARG